MSNITALRSVRESPFRETEWDRRLDDMLEDLENSAGAGGRPAANTSSISSSRAAAVATSSSQQQSSSRVVVDAQHNGYGSVSLQKSPSGNSLLQQNTDSMLKEMDSALKASSNYIESHRSSSSVGPNSRSTQEFHEYRSYSSNGTGGGGYQANGGSGSGGEFNLERQVQHMMPPPSPSLSGLIERSNNAR